MISPFKPITREEAAEILSVSVSTLDKMIASGVMPKPRTIRGSRRLYWHPEIFYSWLDKETRGDTHDGEDVSTPPQSVKKAKSSARKSATPMGMADRARARNAQRIANLNDQDQ